ncbi:FGGY family carbohydrate kinase [Plantactinospora sp. WMMB334]|uniref:FGGY family carbohydrate kinase n=1 Tax=Plantactinospora sp. WMMB334 TaxID=3404119 RepID=UPI003B95027C
MTSGSGPALVVDQGTSSVKAALVDSHGRVLARARAATPGRRGRDGSVTGAPEQWWRSVRAAVGGLGELTGVRVVAVTSFMHTLVPLLADGGAGSVLLPGDRRGAAHEAEFDAGSAGGRAALARLAAWADLGEGRLRAALPVKDYLRYRLTGELGSDPYDAGGAGLVEPTSGLQVTAAAALLARLGAEPVPLLAPEAVAGTVTVDAAAETGLRAGTPVVTGSGDWLTVCLGAQAAFPDRGVLYAGTSAAYGGFADPAALAGLRDVGCLAVAVGSGAVLHWAAGLFEPARGDVAGLRGDVAGLRGDVAGLRGDVAGLRGDVAGLFALAAAAPPGANGVRFVPRTPLPGGGREAVVGEGDLTGLSLATDRADLARAVVDGVAVWVGDQVGRVLDARPVDEVLLCGGGAAGGGFAGLLADVLGRPLTVAAETDLGLVGLARLGFAGIGEEVAHDPVRAATVATPDPARHAVYAALRA